MDLFGWITSLQATNRASLIQPRQRKRGAEEQWAVA